MSNKAWIIFAVACIGLLGGLVYLSGGNKLDVSQLNTAKPQSASQPAGNIADQVYGKQDSKVVLVEYGDFQCPSCASAHPAVKAVTEKYKEQTAFVFRNFPITAAHPNALVAAAAAEAAGLQGKYWEMNDLIFRNQADWANIASDKRVDFFVAYANNLKLDAQKFKTDLSSEAISAKIRFDQALAKKDGVSSTPTFFLNGEKLTNISGATGAIDPAKLEAALLAEMKKQNIDAPADKE